MKAAVTFASAVVEVELPIRIVSEMNKQDHPMVRHRRFKEQKKATFFMLASSRELLRLIAATPPVLVTLTSVGPQALDSDNCASGFKAVRDQIAKMLDIDDGDIARIRFVYAHETAKKHAARVRIECAGGAA